MSTNPEVTSEATSPSRCEMIANATVELEKVKEMFGASVFDAAAVEVLCRDFKITTGQSMRIDAFRAENGYLEITTGRKTYNSAAEAIAAALRK